MSVNTSQNLTDPFENESKSSPYTKADYKFFHDVFFGLYTTSAVFSFLLNTIVFVTYQLMRKNAKSRKSNLLLCLQSCVDFVVSLSTAFYAHYLNTFIDINIYKIFRTSTYIVASYVFYYGQLLAISSLFVFTCERFIAIIFPLFHHRHVTSRKILIALLCSSLLSAVPVTVFLYYQFVDYDFWLTFFELYYIIISTLSLFLIVAVFVLLAFAYKRIKRSLSSASIISTRSEVNRQYDAEKQKRILMIFVAMCCIYTFSFVPLTIWNKIVSNILFRGLMDFYPATIINFTVILLYHLSALINPFITMCFVKDYKDTLRMLIRRRFCMENGDDGRKSSLLSNTQSSSV